MRARRAGRDDDGPARGQRLLSLDVDLQLAGDPRAAADERDAVLLEPRQLRAVVEVVDHLVAPGEHGGGVDRPRRRGRGRGRTSSASSTGRSSAFDGMHA